MIKTVFLMLSSMAILFGGCTTGSSYGLLETTGDTLINSNSHTPLKIVDDRGVCLPISSKSSLNIDVECILEYVQRDFTLNQADEPIDHLYPWLSLNYSF